MAYDRSQAGPFWDWARSFEGQGAGIDRPAFDPFGGAHPPPPPPYSGFAGFAGFDPRGGPFSGHVHGFGGPRPWGRRGHRGGRGCDYNDREQESGTEGADAAAPNEEPREGPAAEGETSGPEGPGPHRHGRHGRRGRGGPNGPWWHEGRRGPPPFAGPSGAPFDLSAIMNALASHPIAQSLRPYFEQAGFNPEAQRSGDVDDSEQSFTPPVDIFSTPSAYVLHVALPGAKKEDVGVNWDAEKSELNLAGVVYRQGDEEFLRTLSKSERKVGVFERNIKVPPQGEEKEEVDGDEISAKLEDGVLVVTIPKVEKEWTEIKKVDIE